MAGLDPAIHVPAATWVGASEGVDHRVKPGDDDKFAVKRGHDGQVAGMRIEVN